MIVNTTLSQAKSIDESVFSTLMRNSPKKKSSPEKVGVYNLQLKFFPCPIGNAS